MGRIVKRLDGGTYKYVWYPGEKNEWIRAVMALAVGGGAGALLMLITRDTLPAIAVGCSATLLVAGFNFGRRDARALAGFPDMNDKAGRRAAISYSARAVWRGVVQGLGVALAAILVRNASHDGWPDGWLLPVMPAVIGALGHQAGMVWDRLGNAVSAPKPAAATAATSEAEAK
jgi:hypothetical protein